MNSSTSTPGSGDRVALDTSVAIDVLASQADALLSPSVAEYLLPVPVVGELRYGALNSRKVEENLAKVEALVARCRILDVTSATAVVYSRLRLELKQKGNPIPENDLWISALCVEHEVPLADSDSHFDAVDSLKRWPPEKRKTELNEP